MKQSGRVEINKFNIIVLVIILSAGIFSMLTIKSGQAWGDDFAMYLMHARNIAEHKPYSETGYIFNETEPEYAPQNYPPGFPLLIAPIYLFAGLNFYPYKIFILICFLVFLFICFKFLGKYLPPLYTLLAVAFLAFSPFLWEYRNHILSDIPAAVFFMLSLLCARTLVNHPDFKNWFLFIASIYAAYLIRPICIVILPAVVLHLIHKERKLKISSIFGFASVIILIFLTGRIIDSESGYLTTTINDIRTSGFLPYLSHLLLKFHLYIFSFADFAVGSQKGSQLNKLYFYVIALTILFVLIRKLFIKPDFIGYTLLFYLGIILIWPAWQGLRFFIPVLPLLFYYLFLFITEIKQRLFRRWLTISLSGIMIYLMITYYLTANYNKSIPYGIQEKPAQELFAYIKNNLPDDAVIMASKPRAFCLYTSRRGVVLPENHPDMLLENIRDYNVTFLAMANTEAKQNVFHELGKNPELFKPVYENSNFTLFEIK